MRSALALLLITVCPAGVGVHRAEVGRFDLDVKATPLAEVLACLSQKSGVKIQYDGLSAPRAPVSISLTGMTVTQVVDRLLEGQGLNYALTVDPEGKGRALLIISSAASSAASARSSRPTPPSALEPSYEPGEETDSMADAVLMGEATEPPPPPAVDLSPAMPSPVSPFAVPTFPVLPPNVPPNLSQLLRPEPVVLSPTTQP